MYVYHNNPDTVFLLLVKMCVFGNIIIGKCNKNGTVGALFRHDALELYQDVCRKRISGISR